MKLITTLARIVVPVSLALLPLSACSEEPAAEKADKGAPEENGTEASGEKKDDTKKRDPFAGKTFGNGSDLKVIPRPVPPETSGGSGGDVGGQEYSFSSSLKMKSDVYVHAPADAEEKAYPLFGFLHGDGGGSLSKGLAKELSERFQVIAFTAKAPDGHSWWSGQGISKTKHYDEIISDIKSKWNVDNRQLYLAGVSGGATFIAGIYLPMFGYKQPTTAFVLCGGAENLLEEYLWTDRSQSETKVHFYRMADDFLEDQIVRSIEYYNEKEILASHVLDKSGTGHCTFDVADVVDKTL